MQGRPGAGTGKVQKLTPEEILICETQARMIFQVAPEDVEEVMSAARAKGAKVADIGKSPVETKASSLP